VELVPSHAGAGRVVAETEIGLAKMVGRKLGLVLAMTVLLSCRTVIAKISRLHKPPRLHSCASRRSEILVRLRLEPVLVRGHRALKLKPTPLHLCQPRHLELRKVPAKRKVLGLRRVPAAPKVQVPQRTLEHPRVIKLPRTQADPMEMAQTPPLAALRQMARKTPQELPRLPSVVAAVEAAGEGALEVARVE